MEQGSVLEMSKDKAWLSLRDTILLKCLMTLAAAEMKNIKKRPLEK